MSKKKACTKCKIEKNETEFYRRGPGKRQSHCADCQRTYNRSVYKERYQRHKEKWNHLAKKRYHESPDAWYYRSLKKYGVTQDQYLALSCEQKGACAICKKQPAGRLVVDHDHATGRVRGLLCSGCNVGLGMFKDSSGLLMYAAAYLRITDAP